MIRDEYSPYKIVHLPEHMALIRTGVQPNPVQIHLVVTNRCNQSCTFCAYRLPESPSNQNFVATDEIPREKLLETIKSFAHMGGRAIQITGGGEPLVHPNIREAILLMREYGLEIGLVTNGAALNDELIALLKDASWVRVSVDAATATTYSMIRRVKASVFDRVCENIRCLAEGPRTCILGVGFVVNRENYLEIYDAAERFRGLGVDNFRISAAFTPSGLAYFDGILEAGRALAARAKTTLETQRFSVFNLFGDRIGDLFHGRQDYDRCYMKDLVPYVGADLNVYTCCMLAYHPDGFIGSLREQSLEQLWNSPRKVAMFKAHSPRATCKIPCMFEGKNHFIAYCTKPDPRHVAFV